MISVGKPATLAAISQAIADSEEQLETTRRAIPHAQLVAARDFLAGRGDGEATLSQMRSLIAELEDRIAGLQSLRAATEYNSLADVVNERSKEYTKWTATIDDLERQLKALKHHEVTKRNDLQARIASARADRMAEADYVQPLQRRIEERAQFLAGVEGELHDVVVTGWLLHPPRPGLNF